MIFFFFFFSFFSVTKNTCFFFFFCFCVFNDNVVIDSIMSMVVCRDVSTMGGLRHCCLTIQHLSDKKKKKETRSGLLLLSQCNRQCMECRNRAVIGHQFFFFFRLLFRSSPLPSGASTEALQAELSYAQLLEHSFFFFALPVAQLWCFMCFLQLTDAPD